MKMKKHMIKNVLFNQIVIIGQNTRTVATTICYFCGPGLDNEQFESNTIGLQYNIPTTYTCLNHLCHRTYSEIYSLDHQKCRLWLIFQPPFFGSLVLLKIR